jgi:hypothetical protein
MGPVSDREDLDGVLLRLLASTEGAVLTDAITAVYGDTYDEDWVYEPDEINRRLRDGRLISAVAETADGELLGHCALSLRGPGAFTAHAGQGVTLPAARGRHVFTAVKRTLVAEAARRGLVGVYSEATAVHPYSQRANIDLGANETGILLGWIPASVVNDATEVSGGHRQSAVLFFVSTNPPETHAAYVPERHRQIVHDTVTRCGLRTRLASAPTLPHRRPSIVHTAVVARHNLALLHVTEPGYDLAAVVDRQRSRLFGEGLDAVYVDLPLERPGTAHVTDALEELGVSYAGIFPSSRTHGDVLRLQSLHNVTVDPSDVSVASEHGRALLDYVLADLQATGHRVRTPSPR